MIVVTAPTGNIGRPLSQALLEAGEKLTVIARNPQKVAALASRGAQVIQGSHDDKELVRRATEGAEALFWLTPPNMQAMDLRAEYARFGEAAAGAIAANRIPYVVHLSSVGAELSEGTGPVLGLHDNEARLGEASTNLIQLRPAYFMENTLAQIGAILQAGSLFTTFPQGLRFPMIATRDIAERAAALLRDRTFTGHQVVELQGASDTGYDEVAAVLSEVLGRKIGHVTIGEDQLRESLTGMGLSAAVADGLLELSRGIAEGRLRFHEPRSAKNTTGTTYRRFAEMTFKPAFAAAQAA